MTQQNGTTLTASFYRGLIRATVPLTRLTLVAGRNGQGKTSIAQAAAAALTGEALPAWCLKKNAELIVNNRSGAGQITLAGPNGEATIEYPAIKSSATGYPPRATTIATGLESPIDMPDRDRAKYLSDTLETEPTEDQLRDAVADAKLSDKEFEALWSRIQAYGWDATHQHAIDKGKEAKGAWQQITGERYGTSKGESWTPAGWTPELLNMSTTDIEREIAGLQKRRDAAMISQALGESELANLQERAGGLEDAKKAIAEYDKILEDLNDKLYTARAKTAEVLKIDDQACPHCKKALTIKGGKIVPGGSITEADVAASTKKAQKHAAEIERLDSEAHSTRAVRAKAIAWKDDAEAAAWKLSEQKQAGDAPEESVEELDARIDGLRADCDRITAMAEAADKHRVIKRYLVIVNALAPEGLRAEALRTALTGFNKTLETLSQHAGWHPVQVTEDLRFIYQDRPYQILSGSEQYRVRATVQLALAMLDRSQTVIFDGADILDRGGRNGLLKMIAKAEPAIPTALVCMTMAQPDDMPNLDAVGGATVWVDGGHAGDAA